MDLPFFLILLEACDFIHLAKCFFGSYFDNYCWKYFKGAVLGLLALIQPVTPVIVKHSHKLSWMRTSHGDSLQRGANLGLFTLL
jgi:hypothetical protein